MAAVNKLPGIRRADVALGAAAGAAAVLWLAVSIGGAAAGQWTITPRVAVGQTITDNARSTSADTDTDLISTATAGLGVIGAGARAQVSFDYDLAYDKYWENDDLDGLRHDLLGDGTAELYREHLFFDARGAVSQQAIRRDGVQTATGRTAADNQTVVINYALGPVLRNRFGDWAESELRYRFGQVLFADPDVGGGADRPDDATTHRASASLTSGRRFTRYRWSLVGDALRTEQDNNDTFKSTGVDLIGEYDVNRFATLLGRVGYEEIDDDAGEDFSEESDMKVRSTIGTFIFFTAFSLAAGATPITFGSSGLASPDTLLDFENPALNGAVITTQFSASGVTFSADVPTANWGHKTFGALTFDGITGDHLFRDGTALFSVMSIHFTTPSSTGLGSISG